MLQYLDWPHPQIMFGPLYMYKPDVISTWLSTDRECTIKKNTKHRIRIGSIHCFKQQFNESLTKITDIVRKFKGF